MQQSRKSFKEFHRNSFDKRNRISENSTEIDWKCFIQKSLILHFWKDERKHSLIVGKKIYRFIFIYFFLISFHCFVGFLWKVIEQITLEMLFIKLLLTVQSVLEECKLDMIINSFVFYPFLDQNWLRTEDKEKVI